MKHCVKEVLNSDNELIPFEEEESNDDQSGAGVNRREKAIDKQRRFLKIALKLASINAYTPDLLLRQRDGTAKLDIVPLLLHLISPKKTIAGLEDFIYSLQLADVTPDLVSNESIKSRLSDSDVVRPPDAPLASRAYVETPSVVVKSFTNTPKRKFDESLLRDPPPKLARFDALPEPGSVYYRDLNEIPLLTPHSTKKPVLATPRGRKKERLSKQHSKRNIAPPRWESDSDG